MAGKGFGFYQVRVKKSNGVRHNGTLSQINSQSSLCGCNSLLSGTGETNIT